MAALQLFNFQARVVEKEVPLPKQNKRKRQVVEAIKEGKLVEYHCTKCNKSVGITTTEIFQCPLCNNRFAFKERPTKGITFEAV